METLRSTFSRILILPTVGILASGSIALAMAQTGNWEAPAQWHRSLRKAVPGTLTLNDDGVEFRSTELSEHWAYSDIATFVLSGRDLTLTTYENRAWRFPGGRRYHFTWSESMPAEVAAALGARVGKPVRNGLPQPAAASLAEIPAHRRARFGGSNGTLRLRETGIDYLTEDGRDAGTWRWSDLQTIANPDPYTLRLTGYREIVEFDLKQPLARDLFERLWDQIYATELNLSAAGGTQR